MRILMFADLALYHHIYLLVALWMTGYQVINARTYTGTTERSGTIKGYAQTHHSWPTTSIKHCSSFNCYINPCLSLKEWAVRWNGSRLVPGSVVDKFDAGDAWNISQKNPYLLRGLLQLSFSFFPYSFDWVEMVNCLDSVETTVIIS